MTDLMLHGILNMPLGDDPKDCDLVTWVQFKQAAREASARVEALQAERDDLAAENERLREVLYKIAGKAPYADDPWEIAHAALEEGKD